MYVLERAPQARERSRARTVTKAIDADGWSNSLTDLVCSCYRIEEYHRDRELCLLLDDYDCILKAAITEWEDNATEWSGWPDSAALSVELYDLTPTLISSGSHRKKASAMATASIRPDRFVPELTEFTLARAFGSRWPVPSQGRPTTG